MAGWEELLERETPFDVPVDSAEGAKVKKMAADGATSDQITSAVTQAPELTGLDMGSGWESGLDLNTVSPEPGWWSNIKSVGEEVLSAPMNAAGMIWNAATGWIPAATGAVAAPVYGMFGYPDWADRANKVEQFVGNSLNPPLPTKGGQLAQDIVTAPFKWAGWPGVKAEEVAKEAGYPNLGYNLNKGWQAGTTLAVPWAARKMAGEIPPDISASRIRQAVKTGVDQGIKPGRTGQANLQQIQSYYDSVETVARDVAKNKDNLTFVDKKDRWQKGRVPETMWETVQVIDAGKRKWFDAYNNMMLETEGKGVSLPTAGTVEQVRAFAANPYIQLREKGLAKKALVLADELEAQGAIPLSTAQEIITRANGKLRAFKKNPTPDMASGVALDEVLAANLKKGMDTVIETHEGTSPGYAKARKMYGAYREMEKGVADRFDAERSKAPIGFFGYGTVWEGAEIAKAVFGMDPTSAGMAATIHGMRKGIQWINNPDRYIANMFKDVDNVQGRTPTPLTSDMFSFDPTFAQSLLEPVSINPRTPASSGFRAEIPSSSRPRAPSTPVSPRGNALSGSYGDVMYQSEAARRGIGYTSQGPQVPRGRATFKEAGPGLMEVVPKQTLQSGSQVTATTRNPPYPNPAPYKYKFTGAKAKKVNPNDPLGILGD